MKRWLRNLPAEWLDEEEEEDEVFNNKGEEYFNNQEEEEEEDKQFIEARVFKVRYYLYSTKQASNGILRKCIC